MNQTGWNPPISQFIRVKILLLKMVAGWNPFFFQKHRFHILHFPNSTGLFTKPTGRHYTKYRFSPDIAADADSNFIPKSRKALNFLKSVGRRSVQGHFTHETESPWPLHFKHSHWWKRRSRSKFASHYAWGTNGVCECKMDVKSTWIPTWHQMDHVSWSLGLFSKTTSWR